MENQKLFSVSLFSGRPVVGPRPWTPSYHNILDIRSNNLFESEHLIGSLRLNLVIENGLIDPIKMNQSLSKFKSTIMGDLNKEDEDEVGFKSVKNDHVFSTPWPGQVWQYLPSVQPGAA